MQTIVLKDFSAELRNGLAEIFTVDDGVPDREGIFVSPFRSHEWLQVGLPYNVWDGAKLAEAPIAELRDADVIVREAWRAWFALLNRFNVATIVLAIAPKKNGVKEHEAVAALVTPHSRDIAAGCRAIDATVANEWVAYSSEKRWGLCCDNENFSILGARPDWMGVFCERFGDIARLRREFGDYLESQIGGDEPGSPSDRYVAAIKRSVRWPTGAGGDESARIGT